MDKNFHINFSLYNVQLSAINIKVNNISSMVRSLTREE